jgi:hypothetical protein
MNHGSRLILRDDEDNEIVVYKRELSRLKGLCHNGIFVLAGKNESDNW